MGFPEAPSTLGRTGLDRGQHSISNFQMREFTVANYTFANLNGQTIVFDAANDILSFDSSFTAANLRITQGVSGSSTTLAITNGSVTVILQGMAFEKLRTAALSFADGSVAIVGDGLATASLDGSANTLNGGAGND